MLLFMHIYIKNFFESINHFYFLSWRQGKFLPHAFLKLEIFERPEYLYYACFRNAGLTYSITTCISTHSSFVAIKKQPYFS